MNNRFMPGAKVASINELCSDCQKHTKGFDAGIADICANEHAPMSATEVNERMAGLAKMLSWVDVPEGTDIGDTFAVLFGDGPATVPAHTIDPLSAEEWRARALHAINSIADHVRDYGLIEE